MHNYRMHAVSFSGPYTSHCAYNGQDLRHCHPNRSDKNVKIIIHDTGGTNGKNGPHFYGPRGSHDKIVKVNLVSLIPRSVDQIPGFLSGIIAHVFSLLHD